MMDATNYLHGMYSHFNPGTEGAAVRGSPDAFAGVHGRISVTVVCADPVIAAGLATVVASHRAFQMIPTPETTVPNDSQPPAEVILADYETAMHLAKCAPQWMRLVIVFSNFDSEARIWLALERGVRGYLLYGASVMELIDAIRSVQGGGVALSPAVAARVASRVKGEILTPREKAVLEQLMDGPSNKVIARRLNVSEGTVKTHIKSIMKKLDAESRTAVVITAQRRGLVT